MGFSNSEDGDPEKRVVTMLPGLHEFNAQRDLDPCRITQLALDPLQELNRFPQQMLFVLLAHQLIVSPVRGKNWPVPPVPVELSNAWVTLLSVLPSLPKSVATTEPGPSVTLGMVTDKSVGWALTVGNTAPLASVTTTSVRARVTPVGRVVAVLDRVKVTVRVDVLM